MPPCTPRSPIHVSPRALRDARALHNYTSQALPTVEATLNVASGSINASLMAAAAAADGTPSDAVARSLDPYCHARAHTGYAGDGAAVWGLGPRGLHTADAGAASALLAT